MAEALAYSWKVETVLEDSLDWHSTMSLAVILSKEETHVAGNE